jgi:ubiquinone biosynthesis protein Coq4
MPLSRSDYQDLVEKQRLDSVATHRLALELKAVPIQADLALGLSAALMTAALSPSSLLSTYDAFTAAWLRESQPPPPQTGSADQPQLSPQFWEQFWRTVTTGGSLGAKGVTEAVVALAGLVGPEAVMPNERAAYLYPGIEQVVRQSILPVIDIETLATCPAGSIGHAFYRLIVDNSFDVEVLEREQLALTSLPPALRHTNTRILQTHDLWHIVAGYDTTALHEIGITAFQLAQFGHPYSAMFLPVTITSLATNAPAGLSIFLDTIADAWRHGRTTPPMLLIPWEDLWSLSVDEIRTRYRVTPFPRRWPANLIEMAAQQRDYLR